jgi:regulator of sirC expression with transglutaminase-like and TPR domain
VFVDPFARGVELDRRGAEARFHAIQGPGAVFDPAFLEPVGRRSIVGRVLANLEAVAVLRGDRQLLLWVLRLRTTLPSAGPAEIQRLAKALAAAGRYGEAAAELDGLAEAGVEGAAASAARFRARLN